MFKVSTQPTGGKVWWTGAEFIPKDHTDVRPATPEESELMATIIRQDAAGRVPSLAVGKKLDALLNGGA